MSKHRYLWEFAVSLLAYVIVLIISVIVLASLDIGPISRALLSLMPVIPGLAICWTIVRQLRCVDELQRKIQFEALGLAFAATAITTFSYGFLENVGFPKLTMFAVWPLMAAFWMIGYIISSRRYA
ncbi:hypothetical protein ACLBWS_15575 [Brucellaceae bacterium D45D]